MVATEHEFVDQNCWFLDSGSIIRLTNDLGYLSIKPMYIRTGKTLMGNSIGLLISILVILPLIPKLG